MRRSFRVGLVFFASALAVSFATVAGFYVASRVRESESPRESAREGAFSKVRGPDVHYLDEGPRDGRVIFFVHGTGAYSGLWKETMRRFAKNGYRTLAIDLPPFGFSEKSPEGHYGSAVQAARIVALLDELSIPRVILFGHSFGGGATLESALAIPDRVEALVLEDIGGLHLEGREEAGFVEWLLRTPFLRDPLLATTATNPLFTRALLGSMVFEPSLVTEEQVALLQEPLSLRGGTSALGDWLHEALYPAALSKTSRRESYAALGMPALLFWGEEDTVIPLSEGRKLEKLLPNAKLVVLPRVNHIPHIEALDRVEKETLDFLDDGREN